ncbi:hypothetical protein [Streptomyces sp. NPDC001401]|uniref:hypothetical protein n=1 Tax=Streptomyces sp. NPDC001401 TaxID=3364570 RepID=UPI0036C10E67
MVINRALRATSIVALFVLTALVGVGLGHAEPGRIQAQDTTWAVQAGDGGSDGAQDTTWAVPASGSGIAADAVEVQPADTTW